MRASCTQDSTFFIVTKNLPSQMHRHHCDTVQQTRINERAVSERENCENKIVNE